MDNIIEKLVKHIKKNNIKFITITESNHRSYTSHTFQYKLAKCLFREKIIDTFSSERLGILDDMIINYYLHHKLKLDDILPSLPFGGMGYYRILKFLSKQDPSSYKLVGLEQDNYCIKSFKKLNKRFLKEKFSPEFASDILKNLPISKVRAITENDKKIKNSIKGFLKDESRERYWLNNLKKTATERGNLFINGFHMAKNDIIGQYLEKKYPGQTLIISMAAYDIRTQLLLVDKKLYPTANDFNNAIYEKKYKTIVDNVKSVAPPTPYEETLRNKNKDWQLIKVNKNNQEKTFRAVGCYLATYEEDYLEKKNYITRHIDYKLKNYDYLIYFDESIYMEKMFY